MKTFEIYKDGKYCGFILAEKYDYESKDNRHAFRSLNGHVLVSLWESNLGRLEVKEA